MILSLEHLDPLTGEAPSILSRYGRHILIKARILLKKRNTHEINEILAFINWITDQEEIKRFALNRAIPDTGENQGITEFPEYLSDESTFSFQINLYKKNLTNTAETITQMEWYEVFATLAIAILNEALDDEVYLNRQWKNNRGWDHEFRLLDHIAPWMIEATEAICIAESLRIERESNNISKQIISKRNFAAAIKKHKKTNDIILEIERMLSTGNYKSMRNAVQIYCENNPEKVTHLAPYNRIRTLSDGLSAHLNGRRRSISYNSEN